MLKYPKGEQKMSLNYFLAILPAIVIIFLILKFDKYQREPIGLLITLFIVGIFTTIPAMLLEQFYDFLFGSPYNYLTLFASAFIGVAFIEELVKYLGVKIFAYKKAPFDELYDGIIYCVFVSLGFATLENILYVSSYGIQTAIIRAVTAVPAHAIFGVSMGYFMALGKAFPRKRALYAPISLIAPVILHGIYDFILFTGANWSLLAFIPFVIYMYVKAIRLIKATYNQAPFI